MNMCYRALSNLKKINTKIPPTERFVWIDLELTGLDLAKDTVLEIACVVTSTDLNSADEGINLVIHQSEEVLKSMNSWCLVQHAQSGLIESSRKSKISLSEADEQISNYIKHHTDPNSVRYLAGNSVYIDKTFLEKCMPTVNSLLHYRIVDVTTLKILCSQWYPDLFSNLKKKIVTHRALDDIKNSINELKEYQKVFFRT